MTADAVPSVAPALGSATVVAQQWSEVAFLHWRVSPDRVAPLLPPRTEPDVLDGSSWVGLIAFRLSGSAFFGGPAIPWFGTFPEINVRLYSIDDLRRRGVVFASLEASRLASVATARAAFGLPYHWANMQMGRRGDTLAFTSRRHRLDRLFGNKRNPDAHLATRTRLTVRQTAERVDDPTSHFLTARWAFHEKHLGAVRYARNEHAPWELYRAELVNLDDQLLAAAGFPDLAGRAPDSVLYSPGVRTRFGAPERLR